MGAELRCLTWVICVILVQLLSGLDLPDNSSNKMNPMWELERHLLDNYSTIARPVKLSSNSVNITLTFILRQVLSLQEQEQKITSAIWQIKEWKDEYLTWDPLSFNNISDIRIEKNRIWYPDIVVTNAIEETEQPLKIKVSHDGSIFWDSTYILVTSCHINVKYFPYDHQFCEMEFGSWTFTQKELDLLNVSEVKMDYYQANDEWELIKIYAKREENLYPGYDDALVELKYVIHLKRRPRFFELNIILPCALLSIVIIAVFLLPCECGEKITLSVTILLALAVNNVMISEKMPPSSQNNPILGDYFLAQVSLVMLSVFFSVFVLSLHHRGTQHKPVPHWVKHLVLYHSARILKMKNSITTPDSHPVPMGEDNIALKHVNTTSTDCKGYSLEFTVMTHNRLMDPSDNHDLKCSNTQVHESSTTPDCPDYFALGKLGKRKIVQSPKHSMKSNKRRQISQQSCNENISYQKINGFPSRITSSSNSHSFEVPNSDTASKTQSPAASHCVCHTAYEFGNKRPTSCTSNKIVFNSSSNLSEIDHSQVLEAKNKIDSNHLFEQIKNPKNSLVHNDLHQKKDASQNHQDCYNLHDSENVSQKDLENDFSIHPSTSPKSEEKLLNSLGNIQNSITSVLAHLHIQENDIIIETEWREVAMVMDRIFSILFFLTSAVISVAYMIAMPQGADKQLEAFLKLMDAEN